MEETIKIQLSNIKSTTSTKNVTLDGYVEIDVKYLNFFKNTWIKYTDKGNLVSYSGGNLHSLDAQFVVLKNIKGTIFQLEIVDYIFYCKETTEQYKALKEIIIEREKLQIEKNNFMKQKKNFFLKYNIKE
jgi:hypothetical protein